MVRFALSVKVSTYELHINKLNNQGDQGYGLYRATIHTGLRELQHDYVPIDVNPEDAKPETPAHALQSQLETRLA